MRIRNLLCLSALLVLMLSCNQPEKNSASNSNPPAEGFDIENSDPAAVELADSIMVAMGGRENWDKTRFISWKFNDRRDLVWDKQKGRVRIQSHPDSTIYLVNINTGEGRVQIKGQELTAADSLKKMLDKAKATWINDSYWLVMPFKLKDTGVTLKYLGEDSLSSESKSNVLQLTFKDVGVTPQNKYEIYVDLKDNLVKKWAYYEKADQDSASFVRPWDNYKQYGDILLSADRSDGRGPRNVKVDSELPDNIFTEF